MYAFSGLTVTWAHYNLKRAGNFARWLSALLSFFPFNNSQYANMCLSESCALTLPSQALSLFLQQNGLLLGS